MPIEKRERKKGSVYVVRVQDRVGIWYKSKSFARKTDAEVYERELLTLRDGGVDATPSAIREKTVDEYYQQWAKDCRAKVSAGWKSTQDQMYAKYIKPSMGNLKLASVRPIDATRILNQMTEEKLSDQTKRHVFSLMSNFLSKAVEKYRYLDRNPVSRGDKPKVTLRERNYLVPDDAWKLLNRAKYEPYVGVAIWIGTLAGLRPGEIQSLKVRNLNFATNTIEIRSTLSRRSKCIQDHPKQEQWGSAPMVPALRELLLRQVALKSADDFVVTGKRGGMLNYNSLLRGLERLCKDVGVIRLTPHELRHTCTGLFFEKGASTEDVRRILNHRSTTAIKTYLHRNDERLNSIASLIEPRGFGTQHLKLVQ